MLVFKDLHRAECYQSVCKEPEKFKRFVEDMKKQYQNFLPTRLFEIPEPSDENINSVYDQFFNGLFDYSITLYNAALRILRFYMTGGFSSISKQEREQIKLEVLEDKIDFPTFYNKSYLFHMLSFFKDDPKLLDYANTYRHTWGRLEPFTSTNDIFNFNDQLFMDAVKAAYNIDSDNAHLLNFYVSPTKRQILLIKAETFERLDRNLFNEILDHYVDYYRRVKNVHLSAPERAFPEALKTYCHKKNQFFLIDAPRLLKLPFEEYLKKLTEKEG